MDGDVNRPGTFLWGVKGRQQGSVELAGDVALVAAHGFALGAAFGGTAVGVAAGAWAVAESHAPRRWVSESWFYRWGDRRPTPDAPPGPAHRAGCRRSRWRPRWHVRVWRVGPRNAKRRSLTRPDKAAAPIPNLVELNYAGTSPITRASGRSHVVLARYARNKRLADACYLWAFAAITASPGARTFYDQRRTNGDTHNRALRALANRLVGLLHGCLRHHTPYDEHTAWGHRTDIAA